MNKNKERICIKCGDLFQPHNFKQIYCHKLIFDKCAYCGKEIHYFCEKNPIKYCSSKCSSSATNQNKIKTASQTKAKCKYCGKEFVPTNSQNAYCKGPHYKKCIICGKDFEFNCRRQLSKKTCSIICEQKLRDQTTSKNNSNSN